MSPAVVRHGRAWRVFAVFTMLAGLFSATTLGASAGVLLQTQPPQPVIGQSIPDDGQGRPTSAFFTEVGHNLNGELLAHWLNNGQFRIYGFPISEPLTERGRTVQYFERARLEVWPEYAGTEWVVQGTLLGRVETEDRMNQTPFKRLELDPAVLAEQGVYYFTETGHTLAHGFKDFWEERGGVHVFGFPISEEFMEGGYVVQYFERARFEWHPENAGSEWEILLGHLGKEYAADQKVDLKPAERGVDAVTYDAGIFDPAWGWALDGGPGRRWAFADAGALNIRVEPRLDADVLDVVYERRPLTVSGLVRGEAEEGNDAWYQLTDGGFVPAVYVDPLIVSTPPATYGGHWVDVSLSDFYAVAYDGDIPVHVAIITAGRGGRTPTGVFNVFSQIRNETMDSATVGFPPGHPEYYYLENVEFTQYFLDGGFALHGNYWTAEANFGYFSSNGCVGLMLPDAEFFWNWLYIGSVVSIHY